MYRRIWHHSKRITRHVAKHTAHLLFPWVIHFLTNKYGNKHHHVIVDTILSTSIIVLLATNFGLGYWFYLFTTPADLNLKITVSPEYIISGSEINYQINYQNSSKKIDNLFFKLVAPKGFNYQSSNIVNDQNKFFINKLPKNQSGNLDIKGEILGNLHEKQRVVVIAYYQYRGQQFSEIIGTTYEIQDSSLEISAEFPDNILNYQVFNWTVHYKNNSPLKRENITVNFGYPKNLEIITAPENYDFANNQITVAKLDPWQEGDWQFSGRFSKAIGESEVIINIRVNFSEYQQVSIHQNINVLTPRLITDIIAPSVASVGQQFAYQIVCKNIGDADLNNIVVTADINRFSGLNVSANNGQIINNQAIWQIANIPAKQSKILYLSFNTASNLRQKNLSFNVTASAVANIADINLQTKSQATSVTIKFNSTLNFSTQAMYYGPNHEQFGYGPYPMEADSITAMRVFWNVKDFSNDLANVTISTTLPSQVEWTGLTSVSSGANLTYNPVNRKVTWHTSNIPSFAGPQGASFEVRVLPNYMQIGKNINITNETYFSALDSYTGTVISKSWNSLKNAQPIK